MIDADFIFLFKMFRCQIVHQMATIGCLLCFKVKILVCPHCHHNSFYLLTCKKNLLEPTILMASNYIFTISCRFLKLQLGQTKDSEAYYTVSRIVK